ncbi:MAG TPA: hypothetical protein VKP30_11155 [Polyangiaceae bacterium]|nr:hypothetical protein [Polyangiaceae bacterium]
MNKLADARSESGNSRTKRTVRLISNPRSSCPFQPSFQRLRSSDSGAVLVIGVFMCACMVGILWYLAGIGDAILFRERLQEASDAVALSSAVLHARGMNLIVLLNLIMACVLAVRVALKALQLALLIIAATVPYAATACLPAAKAVGSVIDATRAPINNTIKALSWTQTGIARITPPAAFVGARNVGEKYRPIVQEADAGNLMVFTGLPVEEGTAGRLCNEAGKAVAEIFESLTPMPSPPKQFTRRVNGLIGKAVQMGQSYFCEIDDSKEDSGQDQMTRAAQGGCEQELEELKQKKLETERAYARACSQHGTACNGAASSQSPSREGSSELLRLSVARNQASAAVSQFDTEGCQKQKRRDLERSAAETGSRIEPSTHRVSSQGMTPKKVQANWANGTSGTQLLGVAKGEPDRLGVASQRVKIAAWSRKAEITTPTLASIAFAQAELFFDCEGKWEGDDCNGSDDESAMWRMRWRARLRRFDALGHEGAISQLAGLALGMDAIQRVFRERQFPSVTVRNVGVLYDLGRAAEALIVH